MLKVFVVDDSQFSRKALARVISQIPGVTVVGAVSNGRDALSAIPEVQPDLVTLDIEMPDLDGLSTLRLLLQADPNLRVIMVSSHTKKGAEATLEALSIGAVDFIDKSALNLMDFQSLSLLLREKIAVWDRGNQGIRGTRHDGLAATRTDDDVATEKSTPMAVDLALFDLCVIGASTGGPAAIQEIVTAFPTRFPIPTVVVQHMPVGFTAPFAARLDRMSAVHVHEAANGDRLQRGHVYVAPAGAHLRVDQQLKVHLSYEPGDSSHMPSVDVTMTSAASARGARVIGVLLTGMGTDGAQGLMKIRAAGGLTIAESEETSVIFGMPRAAIALGAALRVLPLDKIATVLVKALSNALPAVPA